MDEGVEQFVIDQVTEAQARHPHLELLRHPSGLLLIRGRVGFSIEYASHTVSDHYLLDLWILKDYPASPPFVFETEGRIQKDFGHFMAAGNFCLGAPVEVRLRFAVHKNLLCFIEDQVIPYLFAYSYKRDYGKLPFGDLRHGSHGLLQYYMDFFETSHVGAMKLLKCLADDCAPPFMACPCGGGRRLRDCHGEKLAELRPHLLPKEFETELREMIRLARAEGIRFPEKKVMPKQMWKQWRKRIKRTR